MLNFILAIFKNYLLKNKTKMASSTNNLINGRYVIQNELGKGSEWTTFLVKDTKEDNIM